LQSPVQSPQLSGPHVTATNTDMINNTATKWTQLGHQSCSGGVAEWLKAPVLKTLLGGSRNLKTGQHSRSSLGA